MIYSDKILDGSPENSIATVSCGDDVVRLVIVILLILIKLIKLNK